MHNLPQVARFPGVGESNNERPNSTVTLNAGELCVSLAAARSMAHAPLWWSGDDLRLTVLRRLGRVSASSSAKRWMCRGYSPHGLSGCRRAAWSDRAPAAAGLGETHR